MFFCKHSFYNVMLLYSRLMWWKWEEFCEPTEPEPRCPDCPRVHRRIVPLLFADTAEKLLPEVSTVQVSCILFHHHLFSGFWMEEKDGGWKKDTWNGKTHVCSCSHSSPCVERIGSHTKVAEIYGESFVKSLMLVIPATFCNISIMFKSWLSNHRIFTNTYPLHFYM